MNPRHWRAGYPPTLTLDELLKILPRACRRFFTLLDRELEKVSAFYQEREDEAVKRFNDLAVQWKELQAHRKAFEVRFLFNRRFVYNNLKMKSCAGLLLLNR